MEFAAPIAVDIIELLYPGRLEAAEAPAAGTPIP